MASDQGLQCLQTGFSIKNRIKETKKKHDIPKLTNEFVQDITVCGRVHQLQVSDKFKKKKKKTLSLSRCYCYIIFSAGVKHIAL